MSAHVLHKRNGQGVVCSLAADLHQHIHHSRLYSLTGIGHAPD